MSSSGDEKKKSVSRPGSGRNSPITQTLKVPGTEELQQQSWADIIDSDSSGDTTLKTTPVKKTDPPGEQEPSTMSKRKSTRATSPSQYPRDLRAREMVQEERIDQLLTMIEELKSSDDLVVLEIQSMLDQAKEIHSIFLSEHSYLVSNWPPEELTHPYFSSFLSTRESRSYSTLTRKLNRALQRLTPQPQTPTQAPDAAKRVRTRLPELTIPKFGGDYLKWPEFKAMFTSVIGDREDLSMLERFQYLKGAVTGPAASLISNLPPVNDSFASAWRLLTERFESKRLIINSHLERLFALTPMKQRRSASLLKVINIANETTQAVLTLTNQDCSNCLLVHLITRLLDPDTREHWEHTLSETTEYPTLKQLIDFLTVRARALEHIESTNPQGNSSGFNQKKSSAHSNTAQKGSTEPQQSNHQKSQPAAKYLCDCCHSEHYIVACPDFRSLSTQKRIELVGSQRLCCNCLGRHNFKNCNSTRKCKECNGPHHSMLHGGDLKVIFTAKPTQAHPQQQPASAPQTTRPTTLQSTPSTSKQD